jgi:hypothetical protein
MVFSQSETPKWIALVYSDAMVTTAKVPDRGALGEQSGKQLLGILWYEAPRGPVSTKDVMDVVADDNSIYRWTRFTESEPWTFEKRIRSDGTHDTARRRLPAVVRHLVHVSDDVMYR